MRLLLITGTRDSVQIAAALARDTRIIAIAAVPGPVWNPMPLGIPARIGGWGGNAEFRDWVERERISAIIDASHPFARVITQRAAAVAEALDIAYLRFLRPPWMPVEGDRWTFLNECADVASRVPEGARVLIDTGGRGIRDLGPLEGRHVYFRVASPRRGDEVPPPDWRVRYSAGPYSIASEEALLVELGIDVIVMPNIGGSEELPKVEAARRLGIDIAMIRRPMQPEGVKVSSVSEVLQWLRRRL